MATTSKALEDLENKLGLAIHEREMAQHGKAKALQDLKHTTNRCNKLRSEAKRLQGRADSVCKRVKHWQNRDRELKRSRFLWKQKYKPLLKKNFNRALAKIERPSIRRGTYFPARVRQMYYSLLNCRVSEKQANQVVLAVADGLGLTINQKSLPNRRTLGRFRLGVGLRVGPGPKYVPPGGRPPPKPKTRRIFPFLPVGMAPPRMGGTCKPKPSTAPMWMEKG